MTIPDQFGFYAILTNPLLGYEHCTRVLVDAGIPFVQLRMKDTPSDTVRATAEKMRAITTGSSTRLIINDDPAIAREVEADGVHIGQDDMDYQSVRTILGNDAIVGISTHSVVQTESANDTHPDYIGVGPLFPTPTKQIADPAIGIAGMAAMVTAAAVPAVAIGGIDLVNLRGILEAGAKNFCMVRQFTQAADPAKVLRELRAIYASVYPDVST